MTHDDEAQEPEAPASPTVLLPEDAKEAEATTQVEAGPEAKAGPEAEPGSVPSRPATRPAWQRVVQLLLPPVLAAAAVGVHWWLNVPERIRESPNDQGAKKPRPKGDEKAKGRRGRSAQRDEPRTADELDRDWARFGALPFDDEPTRSDWARRHQAIINRAVVVARRDAFQGAPEQPRVVLVDTKCRTVRCRLVLRSPSSSELQMLSRSLERLHTKGEPVWRSYESEPTSAPAELADVPTKVAAATPGDPKTDHYVQIMVAFQTDETETRELEIPLAPVEPDAPVEDEANPEPSKPPKPDGA